MRKINSNNQGSIYPVVIFFICIGIASFLILLFGNVLTPFFQVLNSHDTDLSPDITAPIEYMGLLLIGWIWPKVILLVILLGLIMWLLMDYQKNRYKESG